MLEELLAKVDLIPVAVLQAAAAGVVCLWFGWLVRGAAANRRESRLKQEVLAAKASVPQLESSLRNGEVQIERLQEQLKTLKKENAEHAQTRQAADKALARAERRVSNLNSELNAIRGVSAEADNLVITGFEDEEAHEDANASPLARRLEKTEAAYEKLKAALLKRDERIDELEEQLHGAGGAILEEVVPAAPDETPRLQAELEQQRGTITDLQSQVKDLQVEKDMLESLAARRSKSNRALKEASAEIQEQVPELKAEIATLGTTITDREASISRLLKEVEDGKHALSEAAAETARLRDEAAGVAGRMEGLQAEIVDLKSQVEARDQHIGQLDVALNELRTATDTQARQLAEAEREQTAAQQALSTQLQDANDKAAQTQEALHQQVSQREEKVAELSRDKATLSREIDELTQVLERMRTQSAQTLSATEAKRAEAEAQALAARERVAEMEASAVAAQEQAAEHEAEAEAAAAARAAEADERVARADAQTNEARGEIDRLTREVEDLKDSLAQQERWVAKMKTSLSDKEARGAKLQQQVDTLGAELNFQEEAQKLLEAEKDALSDRVSHAEAEASRAGAALADAQYALEKQAIAAGAPPSEEAAASAGPEAATAAPRANGKPVYDTVMALVERVQNNDCVSNGVAAPAGFKRSSRKPHRAARRNGLVARERLSATARKRGRRQARGPSRASMRIVPPRQQRLAVRSRRG